MDTPVSRSKRVSVPFSRHDQMYNRSNSETNTHPSLIIVSFSTISPTPALICTITPAFPFPLLSLSRPQPFPSLDGELNTTPSPGPNPVVLPGLLSDPAAPFACCTVG
ncbi:hypothetical protein GJ744_008526 [Endocarpon pusillum]|uniref:Uncharacterized protein n=1 Tax=Endocarpon pusillum TaxID=364733 RepID=A0A8H7APT3_9EURO|nr:hypothetical protein GJ744_008526 [Endocarpon pusillum]